jgi:hypothetical protein
VGSHNKITPNVGHVFVLPRPANWQVLQHFELLLYNGDITLMLNLDIERAGFCEDAELLRLEKWSERFILLARELPPTTTLPGKGLDGSAGKTAS